jgi:Zn-finger nucleic acid-binding protein
MATLEASGYACPRCRSNGHRAPLYSQLAGGVGLHGCGACGGVFLAPACAQKLAAALPEEAIKLSVGASRAARYRPDTSPTLACPVCAKEMKRIKAARAGVDLDVCQPHGTFYDQQEIEKVTAAIKGSGWHSPSLPTGAIVAGAVLGGAAVVGGAVVASQVAPPATGTTALDVAGGVAETAGEVALEVGADVVLEGVFSILGSLFD